jgi:hypothetical protein
VYIHVGKKTLLIGWIGPGACDDTGTIARANLVLVSIHQDVECGPVHQAFLDQQRFERLDSKCWVGGNHLVVVAVIVFLSVSKVLRCRHSGSRQETTSSRAHENSSRRDDKDFTPLD